MADASRQKFRRRAQQQPSCVSRKPSMTGSTTVRGRRATRRAVNKIIFHSVILLFGVLADTYPASSQSKIPSESPKERARVLFSRELPKLNGDHLKVTLVEVKYGPGEA